jgi:hypothetical protein
MAKKWYVYSWMPCKTYPGGRQKFKFATVGANTRKEACQKFSQTLEQGGRHVSARPIRKTDRTDHLHHIV